MLVSFQTCPLLDDELHGDQPTPSPTIISTVSKDSGVEIFGSLPRSELHQDNRTATIGDHAAAAVRSSLLGADTTANANFEYVALDDAMSSCTTSTVLVTPVASPTDYVVHSWTDADGDDGGGAHLQLAYLDSPSEAVERVSCADVDAASAPASRHVTTSDDTRSVSCADDDCPSTTSTRALDVVHTQRSHQNYACSPYVTLDQLPLSPSNGVLDDRLPSDDSPV